MNKLKEKVLDLIEDADDETYALILDDIFGDSIIEQIDSELESWDEDTLKGFIEEFTPEVSWRNALLDATAIKNYVTNKNPKDISVILEDVENLRLTLQCLQEFCEGGGERND